MIDILSISVAVAVISTPPPPVLDPPYLDIDSDGTVQVMHGKLPFPRRHPKLVKWGKRGLKAADIGLRVGSQVCQVLFLFLDRAR